MIANWNAAIGAAAFTRTDAAGVTDEQVVALGRLYGVRVVRVIVQDDHDRRVAAIVRLITAATRE